MMRRFLFLLSLGMVLIAIPVMAQDANRPRGPGGFGGGGFGFGGFGGGGDMSLNLLSMNEVREELELLEDQVAELTKLRESMGALFQRNPNENFRDLSEEEQAKRRADMEKKFQEFQQTAKAKIAEVLAPHQADRLKQLSIQRRGLGAVYDEEVQKSLGVTSDQVQKLEAIRKETDEARRELFPNFGGRGTGGGERRPAGGDRPAGGERRPGGGQPGGAGGFEAIRAKMEELNKTNETKVLGVLTDAQKKKLEEMKGEPFKFPEPNFGGRRGGGNREGNRPAT